MNDAAQRAQSFLAGAAPLPPVCLQIYLGLYLEPHRRQALVQHYRRLLGERQSITVTGEQVLVAEMEAWAQAWARLRHPPAWMPLRLVHTPAAPVTIRAEGERLLYCPAGGPAQDLTSTVGGSDRDIWDRREHTGATLDPDRLVPVWEATEQQLRQAAESGARARERWGGDYLLHSLVAMPYWACYSALGFAGLMETMRADAGLLAELVARATHNACQRVRLLAAAGTPCIFFEECLCSSDLISEEDYLRFSYPATRAVLEAARAAGMGTVYYFCGGIERRLEHLAHLPADALAFEESKKGFSIDLARVRGAVGPERPLLGNLAATLIRDADEAGIRRAVRQQFEAAGPLLAISAGSPLTLDTPTEKLDALVRATEQLGAGN